MDFEIALRGSESPAAADAGDVVAALMRGANQVGLAVPPSWRGIVGRHAKSLLGAGFRPDMVIAACWMAILRGRPEIVQHIAGDIALAETGLRMSRAEYEQKLALFAAGRKSDPLSEHRRRLQARWEEISRLRGEGNA